MTSQHKGKFTWGVGPDKVCVAGNFNNWSDEATPLHKQADGSFAADVPLPWGEKQPFKYVVDGEWKVREDEAKEWDAAGNMNNVYTAPHAPAPSESAAAAPAPASQKSTDSAPAPSIPSSSAPDVAPAPPTESSTAPSTLVAAAVPTAGKPAAAGGSEPVLGDTHHVTADKSAEPAPADAAPITLGAPAAAGGSEPVLGNTHHITAPNTDPSTATPGHTAPIVNKPAPEAIETVAANANIGQEATEEEKTLLARAQELGAGAAVTLGAALGTAAHAVEDATGLNLTHGSPISVEEARAKGLDIDQLEKKDAPTDTVSPVGQAPPQDAVAALEQKTQELKVSDSSVSGSANNVAAVPLPGGSAPKTMSAPESSLPKPTAVDEQPKHDLPAQNETSENHTHIPAPAITAVSARDPAKDRTIDAPESADTAGTKPISTDPSIDAAQAKKEAEQNPAQTGSTLTEAKSSAKTNLGESAQRPDAPEANFDAPPPAKKDIAPGEAAPTPVSKDAPSTPSKVNGETTTTASSTPASTPAKSTHNRESTSSSDVKKRKSGFFHKFKSAFSPKDKEKK